MSGLLSVAGYLHTDSAKQILRGEETHEEWRSLHCRKPDDDGFYNRLCEHVIPKPKGETEPRQCRRAATRGARLCDTHLES